MKKFIGIREEWMRPLPKLNEMFTNRCGCCIDCGACSCANCEYKKSSEKKESDRA